MYCTAKWKERDQNPHWKKRPNSAIFRAKAEPKVVLESARREEDSEHKIDAIRTELTHANVVPAARKNFSWQIYCLILMTGYSGNLRSHLMAPDFTTPIRDLEDLLNSDLEWASSFSGSYIDVWLSQTKDPILKRMYQGTIDVPRSKNRVSTAQVMLTCSHYSMVQCLA